LETKTPFGGMPTFCKFPYSQELAGLDAAIVGIPLDQAVTNRPGARFGPRAIRLASQLYGEVYEPGTGLYDIELGRNVLGRAKVADYGDVNVVPVMHEMNMDTITGAVGEFVRQNVVPVILGGDHSITFPILRAFKDIPIDIVHFDTHLDFMDDIAGIGLRYTHANPIRRVSELEHVNRITQIGMRGIEVPEIDHKEALEYGCRVVTAREAMDRGPEWVLEQVPAAENLYVTIDVDVLDPSVAPGTGTPEPGGFSYNQLKDMLLGLPAKGRIVGFDIVEVSPPYDHSEITALAAARLAIDLMGAILG
jgi:agmatinase